MVRLYKAYVFPHLEYSKILVLFFWVLVMSRLIKWRTLLFIKINFLNYSKSVSYETLLNIADIQSRSSSTVLDWLSLMVGGRVRDASHMEAGLKEKQPTISNTFVAKELL